MEPTDLILVPPCPVRLRYQNWWSYEFARKLRETGVFRRVRVLKGKREKSVVLGGGFAAPHSVRYEMEQMEMYDALCMGDWQRTILLHLDLSWPGLFHGMLYHRRPRKAFVFCHATSKNRYDVFASVRPSKWTVEKGHMKLYDKVFVASEYHRQKLGQPNVVNLGALPLPPQDILPPRPASEERTIRFCSVTRPSRQKVDRAVEEALERRTGEKIVRHRHLTWTGYYTFLDRCRFAVITSREETYGYHLVDCFLRGVVPIAPNAYSYPELLPEELLYPHDATPEEKAEIIERISEEHVGSWTLRNVDKTERFYSRLVEEMLA